MTTERFKTTPGVIHYYSLAKSKPYHWNSVKVVASPPMKFYADLHIHSYYSRATSKHLKLEYLYKWAQLKGIQVVGTGDCIHPGWLTELKDKLEPAEEGFFKLKPEFVAVTEDEVPPSCKGPVRFMLTGEISNIYKRLGKVRKVHNVIFLPDFETAEIVQARLEAIGNIRSDGRPILGLDSHDLLEIVLESNPLSFLIPAHIWTPWFSALGSKGGFDRMEDCFGDLTTHIFAVETGLSSDPPMNWRLSQLDPFIMVSNSDAHSPEKLAREATIFDTDFSYSGMYNALSDPSNPGVMGTIEFFPEEGKYHYDGHRKCNMRMHPQETNARKGHCPVCDNPVTVGVMARVEELADRPEGQKSPRWRPFYSLIPLPELIAETKNVGPASKKVRECFLSMLNKLGSELHILQNASVPDIDGYAGPMIAEAINRMRQGKVNIAPGYDGEYGTIKVFSDDERERSLGKQLELFGKTDNSSQDSTPTNLRSVAESPSQPESLPSTSEFRSTMPVNSGSGNPTGAVDIGGVAEIVSRYESDNIKYSDNAPRDVNPAQWEAITHNSRHLLIIAGPGTGKTHTLTYRIARTACQTDPHHILAITFTNKAAEEMYERLSKRLQDDAKRIHIGTFHSFCLYCLRENYTSTDLPKDFLVASLDDIASLSRILWPNHTSAQRKTIITEISQWKSRGITGTPPDYVTSYNQTLRKNGFLDFDDLLLETLNLFRHDSSVGEKTRERYRFVFVDEYQDINPIQHALLRELVQDHVQITAIGDPNQAIYGFRGSDVRFFHCFIRDFPGAVQLSLNENFRSAGTILAASGQVIQQAETIMQVPELTARLYVQGRITIHSAPTDNAEAEYVVHQIEKLVGGTSMFSQDSGRVETDMVAEWSFGDIAVLFRLNNQKNSLVEALSRSGIPFQTSSDRPFILEAGVREIITLLQIVSGASVSIDAAAHLLILHVEGFGTVTADSVANLWRRETTEIMLQDFMILKRCSDSISPQVLPGIQRCYNEAQELKAVYNADGLIMALQHLENLSGWQRILSSQSKLRENWQRLIRMARMKTRLIDLIDYLCLQREDDAMEMEAEKVSLLTLHASKGLEFPVVFIVGCEQDLLPLRRDGLTSDVNEERRLFYVGMTRAKERLYFVRAYRRCLFGKSTLNEPSPFLSNIEDRLKTFEQAARLRPQKKSERETKQPTLFDCF